MRIFHSSSCKITRVKYLHAKFGVSPSSVAEVDVQRIELIGEFWEFSTKKNSFYDVIFLRVEYFPLAASHNRAKFIPNPKSSFGSAAERRMCIILLLYMKTSANILRKQGHWINFGEAGALRNRNFYNFLSFLSVLTPKFLRIWSERLPLFRKVASN